MQLFIPGLQREHQSSITKLLIEGLSIRGIARFLKISTTTIISRIKIIAFQTKRTYDLKTGNISEIDELWTSIWKKDNGVSITYAIDRPTKHVVDFIVGSRTTERMMLESCLWIYFWAT